jgi:4'-phosphopantetheinyl transferase
VAGNARGDILHRVITVWRIRLDRSAALSAERLRWLSAAEQERAARFRFPRDAARWRVAHVALRDVLGRAIGCAPSAVPLEADAQGKPRIVGGPEFNLSHSGDVALVAVGGDEPLGVDVELVRPVPELRGIAESHFASEEREALFQVDERERTEAFYRCWTRKEAFVKATGSGVGPALARFAVSIGASPVQLLRADAEPAVGQWTLLDLELSLPYIGALAVRRPAARAVLHEWES